MQMSEFEKKVVELLTYKDDDGEPWVEETLKLYPAADGCLSASFRGELIPCEGYEWEKALDIIVSHLTMRAADLPPARANEDNLE